MEILLYKHSKKQNSTARPGSVGVSVSGNLRGPCSVTSPVVDFGDDYSGYNYAYIPKWERYYWCSWSWTGALWRADMTVDALASWRNTIAASSQMVARAAAECSPYLTDLAYPTAVDVETKSLNITPLFTVLPEQYTNGTFVICTTSTDAIIGSSAFYALSYSQMRDFAAWLFSDATISGINDISTDLAKGVVNPTQYINSCRWYPLTPGNFPGLTGPIKTGWWDSDAEGKLIGSPNYPVTISREVPETDIPTNSAADANTSYLNYEPFANFQLKIPPFGLFALNRREISAGLNITCEVDITSGIGRLLVYASGRCLIDVSSGVGVDIAVSEVTRDYFGILSDVGGALSSALTLNMGGFAGNVQSAMTTPLAPNVATIGGISSFSALQDQQSHLTATFQHVEGYDVAGMGRPLWQVRQLGSLSGFIQCADCDLALPSTEAELSTVKAFLLGGFFME